MKTPEHELAQQIFNNSTNASTANTLMAFLFAYFIATIAFGFSQISQSLTNLGKLD